MGDSKTYRTDTEEPLLVNSVKSGNLQKGEGAHINNGQTFRDLKSGEIIRNKSALLLNRRRNEKAMEKWKLVPPDGGWGWLVLFGATLVNILVPGMIKSFGVLFVEFLEGFDASTSQGMWIPALCYFLYSSLGPVSSILSVKYSYRTVTFLGGLCAAGGMILSYWATSLPYLYFSYGVLVGCGAGLSFPPTVYIVTSYFVKRRGIANGICISGSAFGSILLPPLLRVLLEAYGYKGACLIMGGVLLNVFVAALFYDPVEKHMKREENDNDDILEELPEPDQSKFIISENSLTSLPQIPHNESFLEQSDISDLGFNRSASSAAVQNLKSPHRERKISMPTGKHEVMKYKQGYITSKHNINSSSALHAVPEGSNGNGDLELSSQRRLPSSRRSTRPGIPKRSTSTSSFQYISTAYHGSTLTLQPETFASSFSLAKGKQSDTNGEPVKKIKLFDISLLKDPLYLIILISNATNAISYTNFIILLPSYAGNLNFDKNSGALLLSIVSTLDLVGRLGGSALSDLTTFPKSWYFVCGLFISGISLALLPFFHNYWVIAAFCSVFGLASGTYVGITAIVMADLIGEERLQSTYGISLFVNGILQLVGPPVCGIWFEATNSFVSLFCSLGTILTAGSLLWSFVPCLKQKQTS
ncbi:monocarboxylate transporter 13 [Anthonomus grandis grandis]|uniref:monocarboxylate transporter 13 n=1 Tax=Anthonomus grandis grandis TaxID=2921223 RepID=UPI00216572D2|nr:monocarboxylate transporter 13 [Anthonomus grandis grandis]